MREEFERKLLRRMDVLAAQLDELTREIRAALEESKRAAKRRA